jgi:hypothetical protein
VRSRILVVVGLLVLAIAAGRDLTRLHHAAPWQNMVDLSAFYCAGSATLHRQDPYEAASLRTCEHALNRGDSWSDPEYVVPAPLPPYDLPFYALLSIGSYDLAKVLICLLIAAAVFVAAFGLADLGVPLAAGLAALSLADGFVGMYLGQIYPVTIALVVFAAAAAQREKYAVAGILAALTLIQPQLGAAVCLSLFIWMPRARVALALAAVALCAAGIVTVGANGFLEWATRVIPAQASAEVYFWGQYSLTNVLASAGVPPPYALFAGSISFAGMLVLAVWLSKRLMERTGSNAYLVLVPAALCVIGGTYVHLPEIAAAIPLALVLTSSTQSATERWPILIPSILLMIPWPFTQAIKALFFSCMLAVAIVLVAFKTGAREGLVLFAATAAAAYLIALNTPPPLVPVAVAGVSHGVHAVLASSSVLSIPADPLREIAKVPTWIGLLWLLLVVWRAGGRTPVSA